MVGIDTSEPRAVVAIIELDEDLSLFDTLTLLDHDLDNLAADFGLDPEVLVRFDLCRQIDLVYQLVRF